MLDEPQARYKEHHKLSVSRSNRWTNNETKQKAKEKIFPEQPGKTDPSQAEQP